ncbi:RNA polymerase sigma factor [Gordonia sp. NPDC003425]
MEAISARVDFGDAGHSDASAGGTRQRPELSPGLDLSTLSDDELAAAAAAGDTEAFAILVQKVSEPLLRYLRRMVDDPQTAEDLAQDTLLDSWRGLPDFAFRSSFRTWMFGIAHRKTVDHWRRRRDVPTDDRRFADLADARSLPADEAVRMSLVEALRRELATLPETSRAVWWLREAEGLSLTEISRVLQISVGSVRGHLQRSRKYLATRLSPWRPDTAAAPQRHTAPTKGLTGRPSRTRPGGGQP